MAVSIPGSLSNQQSQPGGQGDRPRTSPLFTEREAIVAKFTGKCWCGVLVTNGVNGSVEVGEYKGSVDKVLCSRCEAEEAEAEARSLSDAETGRGLEKILDDQYHFLD